VRAAVYPLLKFPQEHFTATGTEAGMTFSVVTVADNREKIVGTIWAAAEQEAQAMALSLFERTDRDAGVIVRRAEEREIPLRLLN
jgi:hypothetical protein